MGFLRVVTFGHLGIHFDSGADCLEMSLGVAPLHQVLVAALAGNGKMPHRCAGARRETLGRTVRAGILLGREPDAWEHVVSRLKHMVLFSLLG